jgi:GTPase involved in cell partitioning and DNA repair
MIGKDGFIMLSYGLTKYMEIQNRKVTKKRILVILNKMMVQVIRKEAMEIKKDNLSQVKIPHFLISNRHLKGKRQMKYTICLTLRMITNYVESKLI